MTQLSMEQLIKRKNSALVDPATSCNIIPIKCVRETNNSNTVGTEVIMSGTKKVWGMSFL
jgi:hypothetical protein